MSELDRYLLRSERCLAQVRRHWAILVPEFAAVGVAWVLWFFLLNLSSSELLQMVGVSFFVLSGLWLTWLAFGWRRERFAVTDKRVLLVSGIVTKRLAVMPLSKVTDMTYERSATGRLLGYGTFIMESAGQDQALSRVDFVQYPEKLYFQLTEELFGRDDWASRDEVAPRPPTPPGRRAALRDEPRASARWPGAGWLTGAGWLGGGGPRGRRRSPTSAGSPRNHASPAAGSSKDRSSGGQSAGTPPQPVPGRGDPPADRADASADRSTTSPQVRPLPWRPGRPPPEPRGEHTARLPQVRDPWRGPDA